MLFFFALVFGFAFFGLTLAHQCNECADESGKCSSLKPVTCDEGWQSQKHCGTMTIKKQNGETTVMKSCVYVNDARCKPGIAVSYNDPDMKDVKATFLCCEGNLCNSLNYNSENSSNKLYNGNFLFIAVLLGCIYSIVGSLFS